MHNRRDTVGATATAAAATAHQQRRNQIKIKLSGFHCKQISLHLIITDAVRALNGKNSEERGGVESDGEREEYKKRAQRSVGVAQLGKSGHSSKKLCCCCLTEAVVETLARRGQRYCCCLVTEAQQRQMRRQSQRQKWQRHRQKRRQRQRPLTLSFSLCSAISIRYITV